MSFRFWNRIGRSTSSDGVAEGQAPVYTPPQDGGRLIVLTAPLSETIDHAGYFIQMALASLPIWMEKVIDRKYPQWREVERNPDGSARLMPAGVRLVEKSLLREFAEEDVVACYPADLPKFIGPKTRVVAVSTHNPLGVTFAAGVYTSMFGSSKQPINSHYAREMFAAINASPYRKQFKLIVGGSGGERRELQRADGEQHLGQQLGARPVALALDRVDQQSLAHIQSSSVRADPRGIGRNGLVLVALQRPRSCRAAAPDSSRACAMAGAAPARRLGANPAVAKPFRKSFRVMFISLSSSATS